MQQKLFDSQEKRRNLLCIFYYYTNHAIYGQDDNYLCYLRYDVFIDHRESMQNILNRFNGSDNNVVSQSHSQSRNNESSSPLLQQLSHNETRPQQNLELIEGSDRSFFMSHSQNAQQNLGSMSHLQSRNNERSSPFLQQSSQNNSQLEKQVEEKVGKRIQGGKKKKE